jgi:hypothetical protein
LIGALQTPEGIAAQTALAEVYQNWVPKERVITTNLWSSELSKLVSFLFILLGCGEMEFTKNSICVFPSYLIFIFIFSGCQCYACSTYFFNQCTFCCV